MDKTNQSSFVAQPEDVCHKRSLFPAYSTAPVVGCGLAGVPIPVELPHWLVNKSFDISVSSLGSQGEEALKESGVTERIDKVISDDQKECAGGSKRQAPRRHASSGSDLSDESAGEGAKRCRADDQHASDRDASDDVASRRHRREEKKRKKDKKRKKKHDHHHRTDKQRDAGRLLGSGVTSLADAATTLRPSDSAAGGGTNKVFLEDVPGLEYVHAYRIDKVRDLNNVAYGSLYKLHVARMRRTVSVPLGLSVSQWLLLEPGLSRDGKRKRRQRHAGGSSAGRYFARDGIAACRSSAKSVKCGREVAAAAAHGKAADDSADYLAVWPQPRDTEQPGTGKPGGSSTAAGVYDQATSLYSQGLAPAHPLSSAGAVDAELGSSSLPEHVHRTGDYNRRLRERPSDVDLWLEFVAFQDEAAAAGALDVGVVDGSAADSVDAVVAAAAAASALEQRAQRGGSGAVGGQRGRVLLEKKLAILDKALAANPSCVRLKAARLHVGDQLWDGERTSAEWQSALHVHVNDAALWQEYLRHCRSGPLSRFDHRRVEAAYEKCLRALRSVLYGDIRSHPCLPGTAESMLDIFVHYCHYLHQCGYTEKAVAHFQAMIEFNCFAPSWTANATREDTLKDFRGFWRRRSARFGEAGARGWGSAMERGSEESAPPMRMPAHEETAEEERTLAPHTRSSPEAATVADDDAGHVGASQLSAAWLSLECMRERLHWLPWRPSPDEVEAGIDEPDDPPRDVTAESILLVLFQLPTWELRLELCHAFLDYLGVAAADDADTTDFSAGRERGRRLVYATCESPESLTLDLPSVAAAACGPSRSLAVRPGDGCHLRESFVANCLSQLESVPTFDDSASMLRELILRDVRHSARCARLRSDRQALRAATSAGSGSGGEAATAGAAAVLAAEGKKLKQLLKDKLQGRACCNDSVIMCAYADAERSLGNGAVAWRTYCAVLLAAEQQQLQVVASQQLSNSRRPSTSAALALAAMVRAEAAAGTCDPAAVASRLLFTLGSFALGMPMPATAAAAAAGQLTAPQLLKAKAALRSAVEDEAERLNSAVACGSSSSAGDDAWRIAATTPLRYSALAFCCAALDSLASGEPRVASEAASAGLRCLLPGGKRPFGAGCSGRAGDGKGGGCAERVAAARRLMLDCIGLLQLHRRQALPGALRCLRQTLELGIATFPHSVSLLHAYVELERKVRVVGRARRLLSSVARLESSAECRTLLLCFSVYFELLRCHDVKTSSGPQTTGTASEYVRALCADADASPAAGSTRSAGPSAAEPNVLFWRLCLLHEVLFGSKETARAVFYRALQHVPWAKTLYMDAIGYFPEQLEELLRLMEEKGIRIRVSSIQELQMLLEMAALHGTEEPAVDS